MLRYSACDAQFSLAFMPLEPTSEGRSPQPAEAVTHWNYGPASRKSDVPPNDTRYDPDWYKQNPRKRGLLNKAIDAFCDFIGIHRAGAPFRNRLRD